MKKVFDYHTWRMLSDRATSFPYFSSPEIFQESDSKSEKLNFVEIDVHNVHAINELIGNNETLVLVLKAHEVLPAYEWRKIIYRLESMGNHSPVILKMKVDGNVSYFSDEDVAEHIRVSYDAREQLILATNGSTLLVDGLVDGIWLEEANDCRVRAAFGMLQLARLRITKTEYISCPSCGRTLFDLQETTAKIRKRTEHLKGVKIGIMGCIVNGPGEMADADYGYVGVGPDKIALYRGQEVVEKGVKTAEAVDKLIELIKEDGNWVEEKV